MITERALRRAVDAAARELAAASPFFTERNLYFAALRTLARPVDDVPFEAFRATIRRRGATALAGLLPAPRSYPSRPLPKEFDAYFPSGVLLVDRASVRDLFVALGVHVHARIAIVCIDGSPGSVVAWLRRGLRRGWRAPFGFLHDTGAVVYPYLVEPLATFVEVAGSQVTYADLGFPSHGQASRDVPFVRGANAPARYVELEEAPPFGLAAFAVARLQAMLPPDPMMMPLAPPAPPRTVAREGRATR